MNTAKDNEGRDHDDQSAPDLKVEQPSVETPSIGGRANVQVVLPRRGIPWAVRWKITSKMLSAI